MDDLVDVGRIQATVTGRYLVHKAEIDGSPLLVGCHGYAENARIHLAELMSIPGTEQWCCCAVQALHPFYNLRTDQVVASWMTRLDREAAIENNSSYLSSVVCQVRSEHDCGYQIVFAGFSQGTSMAYRAAASLLGSAVKGLIILGGDLPPELPHEQLSRFDSVLIGRGETDQRYDSEKMKKDVGRLESAGVSVRTVTFDGGHEWSDEFREAAAQFLRQVRTGHSSPAVVPPPG